ncbi:MAG: sodium-dependent transporter [Balneolales bacterium]
MDKSTNDRFTRIGLILSVLGIAVGTGNIWRFPRIAAMQGTEEGSGAFLFAWVISLILWSIPLIIAEYAIGRNGRQGTVGSFITLIGQKFAWMGAFVGFVAMAIMFYYSVVAGWTMFYLLQSLVSPLPESLEAANIIWDGFQISGMPALFHALAIFGAGFIVLRGIKSIEKVNMVLIPALVLILLLSAVRALTLPGSFEGVRFLFTPDWSTLAQPRIWLEALTQNAWDTGAGWGLILSYAAYMRFRDNITISAIQTGVGNNLVSLLAAVIIFSTVFAVLGSTMTNAEIIEVMQTSGPAGTGLTFIWMPQLFMQMPGGAVFATLFFLGLYFAAFSSLIAMVELASRLFIDMGVSRKKAVLFICSIGFVFGLPSALSLDFFANQDFVWGLALMISGAFIAYSCVRYDVYKFRTNLINTSDQDFDLGRWWDFVIKYVVPVEVVLLLGWWIFQSAYEFAPEAWYNPFNPYSVATCFVQWGILLCLLLAYNKKLANLTTANKKAE